MSRLYKIMRTKTRILVVLLLLFPLVVSFMAITPVSALAGKVVVLTPHYSSIYNVYIDAFEDMYPEVTVEIKPMGTPLCYAHLMETKNSPDTDVWWGGGLDWFAKASGEDLLTPYTLKAETDAAIMDELFGLPLKDPDKEFYGSALSGFGIMYNTRYMDNYDLPVLEDWVDLADPIYFGHMTMARPARSGSTHMIVEIILQGFGWDEGWKLLMQMGANCGEFTEKSGYVPDHVDVGEYGVGLVIDFYGLSSVSEGYPVAFFYPPDQTVINPDSIAKVANGPNPDNADAFIDFVLSAEGQSLLFNPSIMRMPVREDVYVNAPTGYFNPFTTTMTVIEYDSTLGELRPTVVDALFDDIITYRHAELKAAWKQIWAVKGQIDTAKDAGIDVTAAESKLNEAIQLASTPPVDASTSEDATFNEQFETDPIFASEKETEWDVYAKTNYDDAFDMASEASQLLTGGIISGLKAEISALRTEVDTLAEQLSSQISTYTTVAVALSIVSLIALGGYHIFVVKPKLE